jgi:hypothetical protein
VSPILQNEEVIGFLLDNTTKVIVKPGTYKEYVHTDDMGMNAQEVYVAELAYPLYPVEKICGPTRHIVALYFVPKEDEEDSSTT